MREMNGDKTTKLQGRPTRDEKAMEEYYSKKYMQVSWDLFNRHMTSKNVVSRSI